MSNSRQAKVNATLIIICVTCLILGILLALPATLGAHICAAVVILSASAKYALTVWNN